MQRIFTAEHDELVQQVRDLVEDLRVHITKLEGSDADLELLRSSLKQLDEFFLLVIVGEFNAGKSAFLNALFGQRLLTEGVLPTTAEIHIIRYGESFQQEKSNEGLLVYAPVEWLRDINLVDTPGTNAVIQRHQAITEEFVPRSDLVLFVTSAVQPFSESERLFLARIRQWGKKVVIVVNKIDLLEQESERQQVLDFVLQNATSLIGDTVPIFPVSAKLALQAKVATKEQSANRPIEQSPIWQASQFGALEDYMLNKLDGTERVRLKLENPLGIAKRLLAQAMQVVQSRQEVLKGDYRTLDEIDAHIDAYESDMRKDFKFRISRVDTTLYDMADRGDKFFDETLRFGRIFDLVNSDKLRSSFEREVVGDTSRQVEKQVGEVIDWIVEKDHRQWLDIMEYLNRRTVHHSERMIGQVGSSFESNRQALIASVEQNAQAVVDSYDQSDESLKLAEEVRTALVQTLAVQAGALGLGTLLVFLLHTTVLDITGILGASAVAALGFYVLPARRNKVKSELRQRINQLRAQLDEVLMKQFESELSISSQRLREAIVPYTRFVRVEREKLDKLNQELLATQASINQVQQKIRAL